MSVAAGLTLAVVLCALLVMMLDWAAPDVALLTAVVLLATVGVISPRDAFSGFGNTGMLTVAALFVVAAALRETGAVTWLTGRLLGRPRGERQAVARLTALVTVSSAFLNNTAIVATLLPAVADWSRKIGVSRSRLLMPLSFASILGGVCTLIGTSTNLVVAGLVHDMLPDHPGLHEIGMFEITPLGVAVAVVVGGLMVLIAPWLLPDRDPPLSRDDNPRQYTMELMVQRGGPAADRTVEDAGLRGLVGAYLMEVIRGDAVMPAVDPAFMLRGGDRLVFVGDVDAMVELQRLPGLAAAPDQMFKLRGERGRRRIVKAVVAPRNPLVGQTLRASRFRSRYSAVVIAVARSGERVPGKLGDITLMSGDVLLLEAHTDFVELNRRSVDFYMVSALDGASPPRFDRAPFALGVLVAFMVSATTGWLSAVTASFLAAGALIAGGCITLVEARRALDLTVLVAIAAALGLGQAMQATGLDRALADVVISLGATHPLVALLAVYVLAACLTEVVTNNAAAVLSVPVAVSLADALDLQPMGFVMAVMVAASVSFLTPIGYQTNLMVFSEGGYRASDFPRLGLPLTLTACAVTMAVVPWLWPL